jgi:hypothetical protein
MPKKPTKKKRRNDKNIKPVEQKPQEEPFKLEPSRPDDPIPQPPKEDENLQQKLGVSPKTAEAMKQRSLRLDKTSWPVEGNILEYPIADYSRGMISATKNYVVFQKDDIRTEIGTMYGALKGFDEMVLKAGVSYFTENYDGKYISNFSLYELAKRLNVKLSGRSSKRLMEALKRCGALTITHNKILHFPKEGGREKKSVLTYAIFKAAYIPDRDDKNRENYFVWNELFADNYFRGYVKYLQTKIYTELTTPVSKRLYEYLDKKIGKDDEYKESIKSLMDKIPIMSANRREAKRILIRNLQILQEVWQRVEGTTLLYTISGDIIIFSKKKGTEKNVIEHKPLEEQETDRSPQSKRQAEILKFMAELGIKEDTIIRLIKKYPLERIEEQIKYLPYRLNEAKSKKKQVKNPGGLLIESIKSKYILPASYEYEREHLRTKKPE